MLLQRLKEYADQRMELPPQLYSETAVRYIIELTADGRCLGITDTADPSDAKTKRGQRYLMPQVTRTSGIKPLLITDKPDYVLGLGKENAKPERVQSAHIAYRELLARCVAATKAPEVQAIEAFFNEYRLHIQLPDDFDTSGASGLITFRVDGIFPTELDAVQSFWAQEHAPDGDEAITMQCIVCGQQRPVLRSLQGTIKGIPGGQSSGTALISANARAFESYGLENSLIAPTCANCGERFTKALNELLASERNRIIINNTTFIAWTRREVAFDFTGSLNQPDPQQATALREAVRNGKWQPEVDDTAFYAATLSASGARVVVRDWIDTTIREVKQSVARWFALQEIIDDFGVIAPPIGIRSLAGATLPTKNGKPDFDKLPPTTPRALLQAALTGTPLPMGLLYQAVRRSRAEQNVTRQRAALIKLVLLSQQLDNKEEFMVKLDSNHPSAAYQCGRLLAVLEDIQRLAIPGINAGVVERFYGTASATPIAVFSRLVRGAQPHLAKLRRDRPGIHNILQQRLEAILGQLTAYPSTLTLVEQGLFSLGYYHQRAHDRAEAKAASERKKAGTAENSADLNVTPDA